MSQQAYRPEARQPIPQQRIVEKLDAYMSRRDYAGAQRHLLYWLEEARAMGDERGELMVRNELVGHFRKTGNGEQALLHGREALRLVDALGFGETISAGTTYVNVATACNAFGENERAKQLFEKARRVYEESPRTDAKLLGGLYNNMALTCVSLKQYDEADAFYRKALDVMGTVEGGELEQAITYLNMADALATQVEDALEQASTGESEFGAAAHPQAGNPASKGVDAGALEWGSAPAPTAGEQGDELVERGERQIEAYLDRALELLDAPSAPRDGYYAFVCEKCAPAFGYHGYFLAEADLMERAKAIYERA